MQEDDLKQKQKSRKLVDVCDIDEDINENEHVCRFCLMDTGQLVSPCACKGTGEFVHVACLRQWQKSVILTQPTHPKYQTQIDAVCNICETPFKEEYKPVSRRTMIMDYLKNDGDEDGPQIADLVKVGNLLVSSRPKSAKNIELMERAGKVQDQLSIKLGHFMQAIYLITIYDGKGRRGGGSVLAVNIEQRRKFPNNQPLQVVEDKMPMTRGRMVSPLRVWQLEFMPILQRLFQRSALVGAQLVFDVLAIEHFNGGPVEPSHPFALAEMVNFTEVMNGSTKFSAQSVIQKLAIKKELFFGDLNTLLPILAEYTQLACLGMHFSGGPPKAALKIFWGYAAWDGTQLLGEIARRGWGLAVTDDNLGLLNETWEKSSTWESLVDTTVIAKETEYSLN